MTTRPDMEAQSKKSAVFGSGNGNKGKKSRGKEPKFTWSKLDKPRNQWALLLFLAVCVSIALTPGLSTSTKSYDDTWLGQVSSSDIRAPGDFNIQDKQATETKRDEAERQISPVYEYDGNLSNDIQTRVEKAFRGVQDVIATFVIDNFDAISPAEPEEDKPGPKTKRRQSGKNEAKTVAEEPEQPTGPTKPEVLSKLNVFISQTQKNPELAAALETQVLQARSDFNKTLQAIVPENDYTELFAYSFSDEMMSALKRVIGDVMAHKIIADKELMERGVQGQVTIRLIESPDERPIEYDRRDISGILDFNTVNQSLWRYSTALNDLGKGQQQVLSRLGAKLVQPNLTANRALTLERRRLARDAVKPMFIPIKKGEMIIRDGERFEKRHLTILRGIEQEQSSTNPLMVMAGYAALFALFVSTFTGFGYRNIRKYQPGFKDLLMMVALTILFLVMVKSVGITANALNSVFPLIDPQVYYLLVPVAAGAAMVRIVLNSETAALFAVFIGVLFGAMTTQPFFMTVYALVTGLVAADAVGQCRARATLFLAGLRVSLVGMLLVAFQNTLTGNVISIEFLQAEVAALFSGIATGLALSAMTPIIEFVFSYTTDIKLLELANLNHPLLKKLIVQAPGTYHHSIIVGSLVEAAAESIHANPLLARVAAYYHDVGKIKNPMYFGENQRDDNNPHDSLTPSMSVLVLQSHVKEGVELARQYNLGEKITSIIAQHHGTSLIRYFYHKAKELREQGQNISDDENEFRYPGPQPQTREAGLVMLADAVEAASRSLQEPSAERIQGVVQKIINAFFRDGQLNECELTLKDLHQIARAFTKILVGIHHNRPKYPETKPSQEKTSNGRSHSQSSKKAGASDSDVEAEDDEDLKRLGMH